VRNVYIFRPLTAMSNVVVVTFTAVCNRDAVSSSSEVKFKGYQ